MRELFSGSRQFFSDSQLFFRLARIETKMFKKTFSIFQGFFQTHDNFFQTHNKFSDSRQICRLTTNLQTRKGHKYTYLRERSLVTGRGGLFLIFGDQKIVPPPKTFAERVITGRVCQLIFENSRGGSVINEGLLLASSEYI